MAKSCCKATQCLFVCWEGGETSLGAKIKVPALACCIGSLGGGCKIGDSAEPADPCFVSPVSGGNRSGDQLEMGFSMPVVPDRKREARYHVTRHQPKYSGLLVHGLLLPRICTKPLERIGIEEGVLMLDLWHSLLKLLAQPQHCHS